MPQYVPHTVNNLKANIFSEIENNTLAFLRRTQRAGKMLWGRSRLFIDKNNFHNLVRHGFFWKIITMINRANCKKSGVFDDENFL